ncbi:S-adenosyl-l-methionine hydroxide adenosyltransferase family protein [Prosthecochloris sp. HL-130-GSB]|jgi:S-adenosyl-L-methionine hydrolase (adenosine-forming)|uniref:SAM hydrolase/SAM-dependent halogenase family protein n=1 Tax=Prosthecochloris sp. HL-130-GSB TaxID=1974213 RepID=UPI000A1C00DB|nr:SAM-dependent chlorinase/fluorinase [Prosthecochloris sp. HL-130-GSB]ARM31443.1 hypothetical protein B9H02_09205 [Prosthecochloris sp. HL-130-GSB]
MSNDQTPYIAMLTDFGLQDPYVGIMKGVIASIAPYARVIDLTHAVHPQNIVHGSLLLGASARWFPAGTIFVAVVDPGVGSSRRPIAMETRQGIFIAPDNGLLTQIMLQQECLSCHQITNPDAMLPSPGATFHGRDVFSPAAAHLAAGAPLHFLGPEIDLQSFARIDIPSAEVGENGQVIDGEVLYTDIYGNLITSVPCGLCAGKGNGWQIVAGQTCIEGIHRTYTDAGEGEPVAYCGSSGYLEIAVRNGNAALTLGLSDGQRITVRRLMDRGERLVH